MSNQTESTATEKAAGAGDSCGCVGKESISASGKCQMPEVTFSTFVLSLSSSAMVHLGEVPDPETGQKTQNLPLAQHTIDVLAMLKNKTRSCLDEDESRLMEGVLYELRMLYIQKV